MEEAEIWRWIPGYEGQYMVSNFGNVMSHRSGRGAVPMSLLKQSKGNSGYLKVVLSNEAGTKSIMVHRLVAFAFIPNPDNKEQVNHKDGNKTNNHVDNLEWVTRSENLKHAYRELGVDLSGRKKTARKLTKSQIMDIFHSDEAGNVLAARYGISDSMVYAIKKGRSWSDITCQSTE